MRNKVENKFCWYGYEAVNRIVDDFLFVHSLICWKVERFICWNVANRKLKTANCNYCGTKIANFIDSRKAKRF